MCCVFFPFSPNPAVLGSAVITAAAWRYKSAYIHVTTETNYSTCATVSVWILSAAPLWQPPEFFFSFFFFSPQSWMLHFGYKTSRGGGGGEEQGGGGGLKNLPQFRLSAVPTRWVQTQEAPAVWNPPCSYKHKPENIKDSKFTSADPPPGRD